MTSVINREKNCNNEISVLLAENSNVDIKPSAYFHCKPLIGRMLAAILLIFLMPVILTTIIVVRLTSRGPGIYRQRRVGLNGRVFTMYKIRTMRVDAESDTGAVWSIDNDPRITLVGWYLRKLHLDEFPQLVNVLYGQMALVGPRPERPEIIPVLAENILGYLDRLSVQPGMTGLAQVNLLPDCDLDDVRKKLALDLTYIKQATLFLDLRIIIYTTCILFGLRSEMALRLLGLMRRVKSDPAMSTDTTECTTSNEADIDLLLNDVSRYDEDRPDSQSVLPSSPR